MTSFADHKRIIDPLRKALRDFDLANVQAQLDTIMAADAVVHMCHPFGDLAGNAFYETCFAPLVQAMPDVERRDTIVLAGRTPEGQDWVGCCGSYVGTFEAPFLEIPATGHLAHMRFHEFFMIENGKVVEIQAIWDIPELMMQANAWPMVPSLGREWAAPAPMTQDGLGNHDPSQTDTSVQHVLDMLTALIRHPVEPVESMELEKFWHPKMNWYGPAGIGTTRRISGFRQWHQIPFLNAMPDRGQYPDEIFPHFFGEGHYVAVTGWPDMVQTITGDGRLGITPNNQKISIRSLDFWRIENGKIRENWVLVDLLDIYRQLGVDVFSRLRSMNMAKNAFPISQTGAA